MTAQRRRRRRARRRRERRKWRKPKTGWFDMPYEMRSMIIDLMDIQTKGRFSRCSKDCYEEIQLSKCFVDTLEISEGGDGVSIYLSYNYPISTSKFEIMIFEYTGIPGLYTETLQEKYDKLMLFDSKDDIYDYMLHSYLGFMKLFKNSLKYLDIDVYQFPYIKQLKIGKFKYLDTLQLSGYRDHEEVDPIASGFVDFEQVCSIRKKLLVPHLTVDQIFQLKARKILIDHNIWTPMDLKTLINRLLDGELDENVNYISFSTRNENLSSKMSLEKIGGFYAKRSNYTYVLEFLAKRMDKFIKFSEHSNYISIEINFFDFKEEEWTIL